MSTKLGMVYNSTIILFISTKAAINRSQCYPVQITGWPLELMAYAYLAVSPPSMNGKFDEVCLLLF